MSLPFALPAIEVQNSSGGVGSGWKLEFFVSGTSTNLDTYTDEALSVAHANPVVADSAGRFAAIYLQRRDYKVTLSDADDVQIWSIDPVRTTGVLGGRDLILDADRDTFLRTSTDDQLEVHIANAKDFQFTANLFDVLAGSVIKVTGQLELAKGADVASAAALAVDIDGNIFDVTGTTTITSIASRGIGSVIKLHFDGALTLTHNATDLVLPGAANIVTAAGDEAVFYEYAAGDWRCLSYQKAALRPGSGVIDRDVTAAEAVNTTAETTLYTFAVPANTLGTDRALRLSLIGDYLNNTGSANDLTIRVKYGSTTIFSSGTLNLATDTVRHGWRAEVVLSAANATGAQVASTFLVQPTASQPVTGTANGTTGINAAVHNSAAEDSTTALNLVVTGQHGGASVNLSVKLLIAALELL